MAKPLDVQRLDEHLAMLGRLASTLSHEIRNPLGALFVLTDVLDEELQQPAADHSVQVAQILADMRTMLSRMDDLVQDYLSLTRLAELRLEPMELGAIVKTYAQEMHKQCANCGITLRLEGLANLGQVHLHQNAFRRALINLMQNAIDAMPQGGELTLCGRQADSWACLAVQDTGEGIPADQLSQLFMPFHTTKSAGTTCLVVLPLVAAE